MQKVLPGEKHFTAGVFLVTREKPKKVLLLFHKKQQTWLQPGGHVEKFENPLETAIREVKEETGIDISQLQKNVTHFDSQTLSLPIPQYLLQETVSSYGDQPQHFHIDIVYVVEVSQQLFSPSDGESQQIGWFSREEALSLSLYENMKKIIKKIL